MNIAVCLALRKVKSNTLTLTEVRDQGLVIHSRYCRQEQQYSNHRPHNARERMQQHQAENLQLVKLFDPLVTADVEETISKIA